MPPPAAERRPHVHVLHGDERPDDFHWLRDKDDPATIAYLEAENAYAEEALAPTKALQETLFEEFRARIQETDLSVPARKGPYEYYVRTVEGQEYPIYCRRPAGAPEKAGELVMLDENVLADGHDFHALGEVAVSPDHSLLAWSEDVDGDEDYTLRVRDLLSGKDLDDEIPNTYYGLEWGNDGRTLFYTTLDHARRPWRLYRHTVGTDAGDDQLLHQEDDERFFVHLSKTQSERFIVLSLDSKVTSEAWVLDAREPGGRLRCIEPRRQDVEYSIEHEGDRFFVLTNADGAVNFKLMEAPVASPGRASWRELIGHRDDVKLVSILPFARWLVITERAEGIRRLTVRRHADGAQHAIEQPETVSTTGLGDNLEFDTDVVRFEYSSMVTPRSVVDYDMASRQRTLLKQEPVLGGYDPAVYETGREWAPAPDGTRVPVSWVARRDRDRGTSPGPLLLYGYGSYEASSDPRFSPFRLSLLDRGFVFAIAHVRGGGELGRRWYEQGKFLHKRNTFTDLVACADHLVGLGWTTPSQLAIWGGSAGGLLVGAAVNMRPDLFGAVVAEVPFVDVVTTMLDESLPLTVTEWEEWGNPQDPSFYEYMKSYSPYDNVTATAYPPMLVTAGLNDPRVSYHEPAKWVAKLRATKTDGNLLVLRTEMGAGHGGPSGRYESWRELAMLYAFLLSTLGAAD